MSAKWVWKGPLWWHFIIMSPIGVNLYFWHGSLKFYHVLPLWSGTASEYQKYFYKLSIFGKPVPRFWCYSLEYKIHLWPPEDLSLSSLIQRTYTCRPNQYFCSKTSQLMLYKNHINTQIHSSGFRKVKYSHNCTSSKIITVRYPYNNHTTHKRK